MSTTIRQMTIRETALRERALGERVWPDLDADRSLLVVPLGSTEQHGPHLPLDTDTRVATAVAHEVTARLAPTLLAPALPFGASGEHAGFAGTLSLGNQVLELALVEIVRSADRTASAVVLVNGHGGNAVALRSAHRRLTAEGRRVHVWAPSAALAAEIGVPDADRDLHAGRCETSLLLHLAPDLVRLEAAGPGPSPSVAELIEHGVAALSPSGVLGNPAGASADEGARLLAAYVNDAVDRVLRWAALAGVVPAVHRADGADRRGAPSRTAGPSLDPSLNPDPGPAGRR